MKYLLTIAIILSLTSLYFSYQSQRSFGSAILTTASSNTLETFRTNVNTSLTSLQNDKVSTTTAYLWTALQQFFSNASSTAFSSNFLEVGATATSTFTGAGKLGIGSTTPFGNFSVEQGTETSSFSIWNNGSSTPSLTVNGVNGNGRVGIATTTPFTMFSVGDTGATSTVSGGFFCAYFKDEAGRGMWIKLSTTGNTVFSTSTTACK